MLHFANHAGSAARYLSLDPIGFRTYTAALSLSWIILYSANGKQSTLFPQSSHFQEGVTFFLMSQHKSLKVFPPYFRFRQTGRDSLATKSSTTQARKYWTQRLSSQDFGTYSGRPWSNARRILFVNSSRAESLSYLKLPSFSIELQLGSTLSPPGSQAPSMRPNFSILMSSHACQK